MQQVLWHDTPEDATGAAVQAAGGVKKVAGRLWPALDSETAASKLRACLNRDQAQKLSLAEWVLIGKLSREAGNNDLMEFLGRELTNEVKPLKQEEAKKKAKRVRRMALLDELKRMEDEE